MQVQAIGTSNVYWPTDWSATADQRRSDARRVEPVERSGDATPPKGSLPSTRNELSTLTPSDRAAIAGATGYRLTPTGEIINPGGIPPWSFILGFAARHTGQPADRQMPVSRVDTLV